MGVDSCMFLELICVHDSTLADEWKRFMLLDNPYKILSEDCSHWNEGVRKLGRGSVAECE